MKILLTLMFLISTLTANKVETNFFVPAIQNSNHELPFVIEINIPEHSHIYAVDDKDSPTKLEFSLPENCKATDIQWPQTKEVTLYNVTFPAYEGTIYVHGFITCSKTIELKEIVKQLKANMAYTVCDKLCTPEKATITAKILDNEKWQSIPKPKIQKPFFSNQMLLMFIFALFGGLLLNLMPCVLPILSLKVMHIAEINHPKNLKNSGIFFTLGTLVSFWVLAGILYAAKAAGHQIGWGFQLQSPFVVTTLAFVFLLLAMNLFGVFEIGTSFTKLSTKLDNSTKPLASFTSGILACVVATPCSAPFMGASVGFALTQSIWHGFIIFTGLGLGISAPYLFICWHPKLVKLLPKPGAWMATLKTILGFAMMASLVWILHILAAQVAIAEFLNVLISLLLISLASWVYGNFAAFHRSVISKTVGIIASIILLTIALYNVFGSSNNEQSIKWIPFDEKAVSTYKNSQPVFIDFTAKWCITCQVNKKLVLNTKAVKKLFHQKSVIPMQADWTNYDPAITKALEQYGRGSVPLYILIMPNGSHKILPEVLTIEILEDALRDLG
jgi:thiol:disulfide interchange protein